MLAIRHVFSVVFKPADSFDIIERVCAMALETLVHLSMFPAGNTPVNHLEMHHVVTRRCLMALRTVFRSWRRVQEWRNPPGRSRMTVCAVPSKQLAMRITVAVAACAVELRLLNRLRRWYPQELFQIIHHLARNAWMPRVAIGGM